MEFIQYTISWFTFFVILIICFSLWLLTTRTQIGRNIINQETSWGLEKWSRLLLLIVVAVFILVNPIYHLIAVMVLGALYYVFLANNQEKSFLNFANGKRGQKINIGIPNGNAYSQTLIIKGNDFDDLLQERTMLEQCLFSFPYIKDQPFPSINYIEDRFEVGLSLTDEQYLASLVTYIKQANFHIEIIK